MEQDSINSAMVEELLASEGQNTKEGNDEELLESPMSSPLVDSSLDSSPCDEFGASGQEVATPQDRFLFHELEYEEELLKEADSIIIKSKDGSEGAVGLELNLLLEENQQLKTKVAQLRHEKEAVLAMYKQEREEHQVRLHPSILVLI